MKIQKAPEKPQESAKQPQEGAKHPQEGAQKLHRDADQHQIDFTVATFNPWKIISIHHVPESGPRTGFYLQTARNVGYN